MNEMEMLDDKKDISKTVIELAVKKAKNDDFFFNNTPFIYFTSNCTR